MRCKKKKHAQLNKEKIAKLRGAGGEPRYNGDRCTPLCQGLFWLKIMLRCGTIYANDKTYFTAFSL